MELAMNFVEARTAMVDNQIRPADVVDYRVLSAFLSTRREKFLTDVQIAKAYGEYEIDLGNGRAMMTPRSFAKLVELAHPKASDEVLLIGSAKGYEAAILAQISATVIALENSAKLTKDAEATLAHEGYDNAIPVKGNLAKGYAESGPYDLIIFNGAIGTFSDKLMEQLKPQGRVVAIFCEDSVYTAKTVYKDGDRRYEVAYFQASAPHLPGFEKAKEFVF